MSSLDVLLQSPDFADAAYRQYRQDPSSVSPDLAAYFRGLRAVPLVLTPLLIAACFALACAAWMYGYLNLVSAFIFAVQLGLGIDFATHMLARYREELARGLPHREAIAHTIATTGVSTAGVHGRVRRFSPPSPAGATLAAHSPTILTSTRLRRRPSNSP